MRKMTALIVTLALAAAVQADIVSFQQGANGYAGALDNNILEDAPDFAGGDVVDITVDQQDPLPTQALVRFDGIVSASAIPAGSTVNSATLRFYTNSSSRGTVSAYRMLLGWDNTSTWNSFGGNGIQPDGVEALAAATATIVSPADESFHTFDVTADVQAFVSGAANNGWVFDNDSGDGWDFWSSEYTNDATLRPMLTVDFTPIPEPASLLLIGLGGLAAMRRRRA